MKPRAIRINLEEKTIREHFREINSKVRNGEILSIDEFTVVSMVSYFDVKNSFDLDTNGGIFDEYCDCMRLLVHDVERLKYSNMIKESREEFKVILKRLNRTIELKDVVSESDCLTPNETCVFEADKSCMDDIAHEVQLLVNSIAVYVDIEKGDKVSVEEHPFENSQQFELFNYLNNNFKHTSKAKYSYIHDFLKDTLNFQFNTRRFFEYAIKISGIDMGLRPHSTAYSQKYRDQLKRLYDDFKSNK